MAGCHLVVWPIVVPPHPDASTDKFVHATEFSGMSKFTAPIEILNEMWCKWCEVAACGLSSRKTRGESKGKLSTCVSYTPSQHKCNCRKRLGFTQP
ncbi:hypothetical protein Tdes44962_MAKER06323 [Teratosphaeria destructans]|uniref:Uncharacterized protein n=1 Tax=Teratosphaeria destructans TaxID=418781 RepID=A0A9W7SHS6_9PEZI|nr:hypothetical protein Tdes44962_MAKER06323 [Teratosphaeria destructans]